MASVLAVAGCGGGGAATASPATIHFAMAAQNGSGVSGSGEIVKGTDSFTLTVNFTGMTPGSTHVSHIHVSSCAVPGGVAFALQPVVADSSGAATMTTTVPAAYTVPKSGWYVNIHHGPDFSAPANAPSISCGDLSPA